METTYTTNQAGCAVVMEPSAEYMPGREEVSCAILEHIGILRTNASGWSREFNIVSWNNGKPKFDIRDWSGDHTKMSKGITMTDNEMMRIVDWLKVRGTDIQEPASEAKNEQAEE